ncbi:hypothetical protein BAE44_0017606 [Dichanthelium oligosanthes]|uniref:Pectinesterase catalytic domain-containing protein n=1 Tax=Dichanthelium oligosanthes TaxID=888268 RepID=A0A1E5V876_9POAL|nr:hypothetical protein BAE44_0017606 [Dichanthelium oligosanthes]
MVKASAIPDQLNDHLPNQPLTEEMPHWLSAMDASLINRPLGEGIAVNSVVALDGSGNYRTFGAAIAPAPVRSAARHVIHVNAGVYKEFINVTADIWNLKLLGDAMEDTIISGDHSYHAGYGTMCFLHFGLPHRGFLASRLDLRIENTAGAVNGEALRGTHV